MANRETLTQTLLIATLRRQGFIEPERGRQLCGGLAANDAYRVDLRRPFPDPSAAPGLEALAQRVEDWFLRSQRVDADRTDLDAVISAREQSEPLALYLPFHFCEEAWGIYIKEADILTRALSIGRYLHGRTHDATEWAHLCRAALGTFYLIAAFHHKVESFATRLEIARSARVYVPYREAVYDPLEGVDENLENQLATADMLARVKGGFFKELPRRVLQATRAYLSEAIPSFPPGYRQGAKWMPTPPTEKVAAQVAEARPDPQSPASDWVVASQMIRGLFNKEGVAYVLVPKGELPVIPWLDRPLNPEPPLDLFGDVREGRL
jgi:hypothetical protein